MRSSSGVARLLGSGGGGGSKEKKAKHSLGVRGLGGGGGAPDAREILKFYSKFLSKNLIFWSHFFEKIFIKCTLFHGKQAD